ncbi:MAG TPA: nucleotidyltransferase domain-containing protein [Candidatus Binatia bacterium]|jgi:predicted nucleotidyltransferase|nr:nucleotidyltransferase domain-containing protein [Candidatus Binatia bacterium]
MTRRVKLKSKDAAALEEFLRGLRAALGNNLLETKLFGSKATGKDQPDSDIDVLVVVNRNGVETEDRVLDIAFDVNLKHDVYISPRVIDRSILSDPVWSITPFLRAIAKEGISL